MLKFSSGIISTYKKFHLQCNWVAWVVNAVKILKQAKFYGNLGYLFQLF